MKITPNHSKFAPAISLIETVIALGVIAVAIPLVFGSMVEANKSQSKSKAETQSSWMVPVCMNEIRASRDGISPYFEATARGQQFPPDGEIWALAFDPQGGLVGRLSKESYQRGSKEWNEKEVRYIASMSSTPLILKSGNLSIMGVEILIEYPSGTPAQKREKLHFHTHIP